MLEKRPRFLDPKSDIVFKKIFGQHPELIKSFLKRFLFGTSKAYVQQLEKGKYYDRLCPVYGVALVNAEFEDTTEDWFHHYRLTNAKDLDKTLEGIELLFLELPKFNPKTFEHRKVGALWMCFLREAEILEVIPEEFQNNPEVAMAMELAQESAYTAEELEAYDEYLDAIRVAGTVRADSFEEGREEGEKKLEEEKKNMARLMLQEGMDTQKISKITGLSIEKIQVL